MPSQQIDQLNAALTGRYSLERELGAGGMATVYLARDIRHDRKVALKVLRPELAAVIGAERFLVEIKTTANLQHPHILPLHDSGEVSGTVWYVMPLVEGESLRDRLARETQLPIDDALQIAREVASALDYAHRHGVIHRDIKPENILLHDGRAVVADFGIALAMSRTDGGTRLTETGMSLGTPHYMSPEQALGEKQIDARTDVYALAAVLYEMLTGEPPFTGPTAQAIIAKVMNALPAAIAASRPTVPAGIDAAVARGLSKLPADRFKSAADFSAALQSGMTGASPIATGAANTTRAPSTFVTREISRTAWHIATVATVIATILGVRALTRTDAGDARVTAAVIPLELRSPRNFPPNEIGPAFSIAPDGSFIVFVGPDPDDANATSLWMRPLDRLNATAIPGTRNAQAPLVSGDGKSLSFLTRARDNNGNTRWEVALDGGLPQPLSPAMGFRRLRDGSAVMLADSTISIIGAGQAFPPSPFANAGRTSISASPDLKWFAVWAPRALRDSIRIRQAAARTGVSIAEGSSPTFLDNDLIAFRAADGTLQVGKLASDHSRFVAPPIAVVPSVSRASDRSANYSVGYDGTLVYVPGGSSAQSRPVWVKGAVEQPVTNAEPNVYGGVSLSSDGRRAALSVGALTGAGNVWVADLVLGSMSPLTTDGVSTRSTWTRDGKSVSYLHTNVGLLSAQDSMAQSFVFQRSPDGGAPADSMKGVWGRRGVDEIDWSPDSKYLAFRIRKGTDRLNRDVEVWRVGTDSLFPFATEAAQERGPRFSPDGKFLLYVSDRSSRDEVYVESFPGGGNRVQVSTESGREAVWSRDGSKIFYRRVDDGWMMAAHVTRGAKIGVTKTERLFDANPYLANQFLQMYDVAPDGRFLMFKLDAQQPRTDVVIIRNWVQQVRAQLK